MFVSGQHDIENCKTNATVDLINLILMCNTIHIFTKQTFRMITSIHHQCKSEMKHTDTEMKL